MKFNNLKQIREIYGATQEQIARALSVNRVTVANWESGSTVASNANREKMSIYYGIGPVKIKMKYGCQYSQNLTEIDEIYITGCDNPGYFKKAAIHNYVKSYKLNLGDGDSVLSLLYTGY